MTIEVELEKDAKNEARGTVCFAWGNMATANCGVHGISSFYAEWHKPKIVTEAKDPWGGSMKKKIFDPKFKGAPPTALEVYQLLVKNVDKIAESVKSYGIIFLSDRMVEGYDYGIGPKVRVSDATLKKTVPTPTMNGAHYLNTGCLIRAIRESKIGGLMTSPLVENPNHKGNSGIVAALWLPEPKYIINPSYGIRGMSKQGNLKIAAKLRELGKEFVEKFYE